MRCGVVFVVVQAVIRCMDIEGMYSSDDDDIRQRAVRNVSFVGNTEEDQEDDDETRLVDDFFIRGVAELVQERDVLKNAIPTILEESFFLNRNFVADDRSENLRKMLVVFWFLFIRERGTIPDLWIGGAEDASFASRSRRVTDTDVIVKRNEVITISSPANTLTVVIGSGNTIYIKSALQKVIVVGGGNKVKIEGIGNFVYSRGDGNKIEPRRTGNNIFIDPRSTNGKLYMTAPGNNAFVSGSHMKVCVESRRNVVVIGPLGNRNRVYVTKPRNWVWINGDSNKFVSSARQTHLLVGIGAKTNRVVFEGDRNTINVNGAENILDATATSRRNVFTLSNVSRSNSVNIVDSDNTYTDNGINNTVIVGGVVMKGRTI
ncbi:MAG: uncharacterized protein A8A55_0741 [Amphiamblys sp. WSBS2006]|nr:MAG: uncharacterized protein A8A55_0741 [Amphiamblys sp. WSBS2006]